MLLLARILTYGLGDNMRKVLYRGQQVDVDTICCPKGYRIILSGKYPDELYVAEIRRYVENKLYYGNDNSSNNYE